MQFGQIQLVAVLSCCWGSATRCDPAGGEGEAGCRQAGQASPPAEAPAGNSVNLQTECINPATYSPWFGLVRLGQKL